MNSDGHPADLLPTHTPALFEQAVERAANLLRAGQVVAVPTETVYGLAANAFDPEAVARIYRAKGRPAHNPIIVHVVGADMALKAVRTWPDLAAQLSLAFWPGPLTLVMERSASVPDIVTAGGNTVGIRWPSHPFVQALIQRCGFPLAAPSANVSNAISPTMAEHVKKQLGDRIPLIVDGGPSAVGIESTVVDITSFPPTVLRPGIISTEAIAGVAGSVRSPALHGQAVLRSPGLLPRHYAPRAKLIVAAWKNDAELMQRIAAHHVSFPAAHIITHRQIPAPEVFGRVALIPHDAEAYARAIYAELHRSDELGAELIVVEKLPEEAAWHALADRLARASSPK